MVTLVLACAPPRSCRRRRSSCGRGLCANGRGYGPQHTQARGRDGARDDAGVSVTSFEIVRDGPRRINEMRRPGMERIGRRHVQPGATMAWMSFPLRFERQDEDIALEFRTPAPGSQETTVVSCGRQEVPIGRSRRIASLTWSSRRTPCSRSRWHHLARCNASVGIDVHVHPRIAVRRLAVSAPGENLRLEKRLRVLVSSACFGQGSARRCRGRHSARGVRSDTS